MTLADSRFRGDNLEMPCSKYILGSRSPRRRELLQLLIPPEQILVLPPSSADEADFDGLDEERVIASRLREIVQTKRCSVEERLDPEQRASAIRLVADTIIVAREENGRPTVLGQPPASPEWPVTVRDWFQRYYSGRSHAVWTGVCVWNSDRVLADEIAATTVTFRPISADEIDWYLSTGESLGKAGGYALQGLASLFVEQVQGSLSNVIGLPLEVVQRAI
jgi:septum formation protein